MFDLDNEKKIVNSNVRHVFTPYQPIMDKELFFGREKEVSNVIKQLNTPGQHSILFGDRGVGKSSLANITAEMLKTLTDGNLIKKRCSSDDTFISIIEGLLNQSGVDLTISSSQQQTEVSGSGGINVPGLRVGAKAGEKGTTNFSGLTEKANSPSWVAEVIKEQKALFLLDEVDVISDDAKKKVAELIKLLSDSGSPLKFLVVGIAETSSELTNGHPSVQRCLKETHLPKMSDKEIEELISNGAQKIQLSFSGSAMRKITSISAGYPHFAHLLALKASEKVICEDRKRIELHDVNEATNDASGDAEGTLKTIYHEAIRSSNTEEFKKILIAASVIKDEEFKAEKWRDSYHELWGAKIEQKWLNNYLTKIVSEDNSFILKRLAKGVYKFNDPRMPSYIRLVNLSMIPD